MSVSFVVRKRVVEEVFNSTCYGMSGIPKKISWLVIFAKNVAKFAQTIMPKNFISDKFIVIVHWLAAMKAVTKYLKPPWLSNLTWTFTPEWKIMCVQNVDLLLGPSKKWKDMYCESIQMLKNPFLVNCAVKFSGICLTWNLIWTSTRLSQNVSIGAMNATWPSNPRWL